MALSHEGRVLKTTRGTVRGRIISAPRGTSGFGYDPIFFYRPFGRTFGELTDEEKQSDQPSRPRPQADDRLHREGGEKGPSLPLGERDGKGRRGRPGWAEEEAVQTVSRSFSFRKTFSPIPRTFMRSSTFLKFPFSFR